MSNHHLGVGVKWCPPCGSELVEPHRNRILKLDGRERCSCASLISSAFFVPLSSLTPASFEALHSTGVVTKSKESTADSIRCAHPVQSSRSSPWRSPYGQQQMGSYSWGASRVRSNWGSPHPTGKYPRSLRS